MNCCWQSKKKQKCQIDSDQCEAPLNDLFTLDSFDLIYLTIVSTPFELSEDDFESESNELELAFFDAEL